jgi:SNF2 family DNA or RNA helicase
MLRRMKCDIDLKLPPKKEILVFTPMSPEQKDLYKHILHKTIHEKLQKDKVCRKNTSLLVEFTVCSVMIGDCCG